MAGRAVTDSRSGVKLRALKGAELPGKVLSFYIVPLDPAIEGGVKGNLPAKTDPVMISTFPGSLAL
jgi:hypothetical protein